MDDSIITKNIETIVKHYPDMYITQLGMVCMMLGVIGLGVMWIGSL
jgi:hypothetical protein